MIDSAVTEQRIIVFDLETVPDLGAGRSLLGEDETAADADVRGRLGARYAKQGEDPNAVFVKVPLQKIVCIGALYAQRPDRTAEWSITRSGVGHIGLRSERQLLESFVFSFQDRPAPQLVGFNSSSFDLPVLRYRALALSVAAPELHRSNGRDYWYRFGRDHIDLCDVLSNFGASPRPSLNELSALCGIPPKLEGIDGSRVESFVNSSRIEDVANYCEFDVLSTYLLFLRYMLVVGDLSVENYERSTSSFAEFISSRVEKRPHLSSFVGLNALANTGGSAS
jgi:predicted PolB exonuclease-like 3'-5' exonuclease